MKPHKHAELIKAWADGAEVEFYSEQSKQWIFTAFPHWGPEDKFRIKPEPDFSKTMDVYINTMYDHYPSGFQERRLMIDNFALLGIMSLTFDGTTRKLKSAEVL